MNSHKTLEKKEYVKYLGVCIDTDPFRKHHIELISETSVNALVL